MSDQVGAGRGLAAIVHGVVTAVLPPHPRLDPPARAVVEREVTQYVVAQLAALPAFMRLPLRLALHAFAWLPAVRHARSFPRLPAAHRAAYLAGWDRAPLAAARDLIKLLRSTALLVYFDHPLVLERLEAERDSGGRAHG